MKNVLELQRGLESSYGLGVGVASAKRTILGTLEGFPTGKATVVSLMWGLAERMPPLGQTGTTPVVFRQELPDDLHGIGHQARAFLNDRVPQALKGLDSEQPARLAGKVKFEELCRKFGLPVDDHTAYDLYRHRQPAEFGSCAPAFSDGIHHSLANAVLWLHKFPAASSVSGIRRHDVLELLERFSTLQIRSRPTAVVTGQG